MLARHNNPAYTNVPWTLQTGHILWAFTAWY